MEKENKLTEEADKSADSALLGTREIKFRFWDEHNKNMHKQPNHPYKSVRINRLIHNYSEHELGGNSPILMQYTGLKDKNGKEIYEGDIVKWGHIKPWTEITPRIAVVTFDPNLKFRQINTPNRDPYDFEFGSFIYTNTNEAMEVSGNIFENPELLDECT